MHIDKARDKCGVFGIFNHQDAIRITHKGIKGLQHRGEESWGEASCEGRVMHLYRRMGLISPSPPDIEGNSAIAHTRYSTASTSDIGNAQPIVMADESTVISASDISRRESFSGNPIAGGHNGNLTGGLESITQKGSDTRKLMHKIGNPPEKEIVDRIVEILLSVQGAYSILFLTPDIMIGARDPFGYRPLSLGVLDGSYMLSSETCAIKDVGGIFKRDISPGELIAITKEGLYSRFIGHEKKLCECIFENIYIARPDSFVFGERGYDFKFNCGRQLARENPKDKEMADIVLAIPDAGIIPAFGYSEESGIPFVHAILRNHYTDVGRAFILPTQEQREEAIENKLRVIEYLVYGKRVILVDDSIVSGTNAKSAIRKVEKAGAREIHVRAASPHYKNPCYWGVDTPSVERFIAHNRNDEQIARELGADSVAYLSLKGMLNQTSRPYDKCVKCFDRYYNETNNS